MRRFGTILLESLTPILSRTRFIFSGTITPAITIGPKTEPLPASSTPKISILIKKKKRNKVNYFIALKRTSGSNANGSAATIAVPLATTVIGSSEISIGIPISSKILSFKPRNLELPPTATELL